MIKLKNVEAAGFVTPALAALMNDASRPFPMKDSFKILHAIDTITKGLTTYFKLQKDIIKENKGVIAPDGRVTYEVIEDQVKAQEEMNELNDIEIEVAVDKIKPSGGWPSLTLGESLVLRPIIDME